MVNSLSAVSLRQGHGGRTAPHGVTGAEAPPPDHPPGAFHAITRSPPLPIGGFRAQSPPYPGDLPCSSQCTSKQPHDDQHQSALQRRALSVGQERNGKAELDRIAPGRNDWQRRGSACESESPGRSSRPALLAVSSGWSPASRPSPSRGWMSRRPRRLRSTRQSRRRRRRPKRGMRFRPGRSASPESSRPHRRR